MARKKGTTKKKTERAAESLAVVHRAVAGIDLGARQHWVCAPARSDGTSNVRVFGTTTPQLLQLVDWLSAEGVESVAMESTSVYWIPIYEILESRGMEAVLVNARQLHNVPGRKTDMQDCQWIQLLHGCGLLRGSFRPPEAIASLRALHRQMANLVEERTKFIQWMQKSLDQMNVQVHRAVTDLTGTTGMAIVRAIVAGERDANRLADLRDHRCRKSHEEIAEYLTGTWRDEHIFNLTCSLQLFDSVQQMIETYEQRLRIGLEALEPDERKSAPPPPHPNPAKQRSMRTRGQEKTRQQFWRFSGVDLTRIDGISVGAAQTIFTEIGPSLEAFPAEKDFVSWLRLAPRRPVSGGKVLKKRRNGLGASRVANSLRMSAVSLRHSKTALGAAFRRIARRKDAGVAVFAMARRLAQLVYRALRYGQEYLDVGVDAYESQFEERRLSGLKHAARALGYQLTPAALPNSAQE